jgi:hypothetical protein
MEKFRKIKTFESYEKAGNLTALPANPEPSSDEINNRIKEIITNILKTKQYIMLLQDTAENVFEMLEKQIPPNKEAFVNTLYEKDQFLAELVEQVCDMLDNSNTLQELDEMVMTIKNLDQYTDDNMDDILSGNAALLDDDYEDEDEDEDEHMCPKCEGTGENEDGVECDVCDGTGFKSYIEVEEENDVEEVDIEPSKRTEDDSKEQHQLEDQLKREKK